MTDPAASFENIPPEGPFAYKISRDQPVGQHFNRFKELSPEQTAELFAVRDGSRPHCIISLPDELILAEYAGTGYVDESSQRSWGYTIRRRPVVADPESSESRIAAANGVHAAAAAESALAAEQLRQKYEKELQDVRLEAIQQKARTRELEAQLVAQTEKHAATATGTHPASMHSGLDVESLKFAGGSVDLKAGDLVTSINPDDLTQKQKNDKFQTNLWLQQQKKKLNEDQAAIRAETARLINERKSLESMRAQFKNKTAGAPAETETPQVKWVAPQAYSGGNYDGTPSQSDPVLLRRYVCWIVAILLIFRCIWLIYELAAK